MINQYTITLKKSKTVQNVTDILNNLQTHIYANIFKQKIRLKLYL